MKVSGRPAIYNEYIDHRNRLRTLLKNLSRRSLLGVAPHVLAFEAGSMIHRVRNRQWPNAWRRAQAWFWNIRRLPDTLSRRRAVQRRRMIADKQLEDLFARSGGSPRLRASLPGYPETYDDSIDRSRLSPIITMGTNDTGALGLGWYGLESFAGIPSRWCCGYGIAFLNAPKESGPATLKIRCAASWQTKLIVRTDRQERGRFIVNAGPWQEIETCVPHNGDTVRVELLVAPTTVPSEKDPSSPDHRTLGVAVAQIALSPCESAS
jgi:hypothetical protein